MDDGIVLPSGNDPEFVPVIDTNNNFNKKQNET